ncbi:uncharacterized protein HMPREF1541_08797 [Cyphellophora europaea CBS 101466]|uniref:Alpha/beta hydrolase fold-3 domain-containing protein n=1 Tax=Cyphellophora europaea (strain CBS 101466) TaxID=1220924 RepID=W2RLB3_CYPE1|nr:uncharacterized protein HMPREF1541_08797 [Cyphellophora europaea CBS 101466]ETN36519.1 hypothetical protein HMPREF1541_08797 [Cyphellophora europaea CBS 101466]
MSAVLYKHFHPIIDFCRSFGPSSPPIAWSLRLRLLLFQPIITLTALITHAPYFLRRKPYTTLRIPTRSGGVRALLYNPRHSATTQPDLRPLHLDLHGGAFAGGNPEANVRFCAHIAATTGCVVVSTTYRIAPIHPFPAAIDDVDDVVSWLHMHAEEALGANPRLMTVGGSSAGGNLAVSSCQGEGCHGRAETAMKGVVTFYAPLELRLPPWEKPHPPSIPQKDPMRVFLPLYDAYARLAGVEHQENPRLSPVVMDVTMVPDDVLLVIPGIDILVHEQETFVERVRKEATEKGLEKRVEVLKIEEAFHGWMELPSFIMEEQRVRVLNRATAWMKEVHRRHGFVAED